MKIVSVMTTDSSGGAEFAAVEMLEALRQRGHDTVMLTDMSGMARDTEVTVSPIELGPKLSTRSWIGLMLRWPSLRRRLRTALHLSKAPIVVKLAPFVAGVAITIATAAGLMKFYSWCIEREEVEREDVEHQED